MHWIITLGEISGILGAVAIGLTLAIQLVVATLTPLNVFWTAAIAVFLSLSLLTGFAAWIVLNEDGGTVQNRLNRMHTGELASDR